MTRTSSPTVWRRWMAHELRRLRTEAGLSQGAVAKALGCKVPKVSLMESAGRNVQEDDLGKLLDLFEVPRSRRPEYVEAVRQSREKAWWEFYDDNLIPDWLQTFVGLEQGATRSRTFQSAIFHGLLQTPEYTAAILRGSAPLRSEETIARMVDLRARRQLALTRETDPLELWVVVDEAALRHVVGSPTIMRKQFEHVVDVAGQRDNVTIQVIPFERGAPWEADYGPFTVLSFPSPGDPGVVYIEHRSGGLILDSLPDVDAHSTIFDRLSALALNPDESLQLLRRTAREHG